VRNQKTTQKHINKIIEFRQAIYAYGLQHRKDALFEILDAICLNGHVAAFPQLSLDQVHRRTWHSLYKAVQKGNLDEVWLSRFLAQQVPRKGVQYFSLDGTAWPRPRARTLDDRQYVYHPTAAVKGGSVCIGYPYSLLDWVPEAHSSWSLSLSVARIPSHMTAREMGVAQIQALSQARLPDSEGLDIVAADGKYGNAGFLRPLQSQNCGLVVRLRKDRVLYRAPELPKQRKRGRPRLHGKRFAFKEPQTWDRPDAEDRFEHPRLGQVQLQRWNGLHGKFDADVPFEVIRASIHLERDKAPRPIWLAWQAPAVMPQAVVLDTRSIWQAYVHRWPVEPSIRFRKQRLGWTRPQFQDKETCDRWSWLVALAMWLFFLARPIVQDHPLPWQKPQQKLTPQRVQQALPLIFSQFGTPAKAPKVRGKPPGWQKGRPRTPKTRFKVVKKQPAAA
jgi:hypothetical protein